MRTLTLLPSALVLALLPPLPLAAQAQASSVSQQQAADPHRDLVRVIGGQVDREQMLEQVLREARAAMLTHNPDIAGLEQRFPGTLDKMIAAMRPYLQTHADRIAATYQERAVPLLASALTRDEARDAALFYGSPLGRRMIDAFAASYTGRASIDEVLRSGNDANISSDALQRDNRAAVAGAVTQLSPADRAEAERILARSSWLPKLMALQPRMATLQAETENMPMSAADEAGMQQAVMRVLEQLDTSGNK